MTDVAALASAQAGVLSAVQLRRAGVSWSLLRSQLGARRWRRVLPGVYAVFTGPLPDLARVWAAVLWAGPGGVLVQQTAAWVWGLRADLSTPLMVAVPHGHPRRTRATGIRVVQSTRLVRTVHPAKRPPVTTVEDTVLDIVHRASRDGVVIDTVLHACQERLTTPARLTEAVSRRRRLRWRALVRDLLADVRDGVTSPLERRYVHDVERPHGLPRGVRNRGEGTGPTRRYRDVRYQRWRLVGELDGRATHPADQREHDDGRDNEVALRLERTSRFGWRAVTGTPCLVAGQVGTLLARAGWPGSLTACGPTCRVADSPTTDALTARCGRERIGSGGNGGTPCMP